MNDQLIELLFEKKCLSLSPKDPFTYTSGLKGPIYCDCRLIATHPVMRDLVVKGFGQLIETNDLQYDYLTGVATAGISHAAYLADRRKELFCYSRSKPKGHGKGKMVEGDVDHGARLLLVEDLINQGASIEQVILKLREQAYVVENTISIVNYNTPKSLEVMKNLKVECFSLISFQALADKALKLNIVDNEGHELLLEWNKDPVAWSEKA